MIKQFRTLGKVLRTFGLFEVIRLTRSKFRRNRGRDRENVSQDWWKKAEYKKITSRNLAEALTIETTLVSNLVKEFDDNHFNFEKNRQGFFDNNYDLGKLTQKILYILIRYFKPLIVIETGVAAGISSTIILSALLRNEKGVLNSVDITHKVGELIPRDLRVNWKLTVLNRSRKSEFIRFTSTLEECSIFVHDSDHSISWQIFELNSICDAFPSVKTMIFDDVNEEIVIEAERRGFRSFICEENNKISAVFTK